MRSTLKKIASATLLSSFLLSSVNAADNLEATLSGNTDSVFTIGGNYHYSDLKIGLGVITIKDIQSNTNYEDDFYGGYILLGYEKTLSTDFNMLLDAVYVNGETKDSDQSLDKLIAGAGLKYTEESYLNPTIGINTEETAFLTISKKLTSYIGVCLGTAYDWDDNEGSAFLTLSYGNGLSCNSSFIGSVKTALEDEFKTGSPSVSDATDETDTTIDIDLTDPVYEPDTDLGTDTDLPV